MLLASLTRALAVEVLRVNEPRFKAGHILRPPIEIEMKARLARRALRKRRTLVRPEIHSELQNFFAIRGGSGSDMRLMRKLRLSDDDWRVGCHTMCHIRVRGK